MVAVLGVVGMDSAGHILAVMLSDISTSFHSSAHLPQVHHLQKGTEANSRSSAITELACLPVKKFTGEYPTALKPSLNLRTVPTGAQRPGEVAKRSYVSKRCSGRESNTGWDGTIESN